MAKEKLFQVGVKALITNSKGQFLIFEANPQEMRGDKTPHWDLAGGRIQEGHSVDETLRREIKEETGITELGNIKFFTAVVSNMEIPISEDEKVGLVLMIYKVGVPHNVSINIDNEHLSYEWVSAKEAAKRLAIKYPPEFTDLLR